MKTLIDNIVNIFGKQGEVWLQNLPNSISQLALQWNLVDITPFNNMTFNYVAYAIANNNPVVLKISCDAQSMLAERQALLYFNGKGVIQLIAACEQYHALLLQQAIPGTTLKSIYSTDINFVIPHYVTTMRKLHHHNLAAKHPYQHVSDWLKVIDQLQPGKYCSPSLLQKTINLKNALLASMQANVFLHGDLHLDNILQHEDSWIAIDPKGIVGEPEFEAAAFNFMHVHELASLDNAKHIIKDRVYLLAQKSNLNSQRIYDWIIVRLVLMAAWQIEDNIDSSWAIQLAKALI